jgi:pilus assembly protein CpaC
MYCDVIIDLIKGYSCGSAPVYGTEESNAIQIDVQVIEINKDNTLDLGFEWFPAGTPMTGRIVTKSTSPTSSDANATPLADINFGAFDAQAVNVQTNIIALAAKGKAKFLSNPKLIVQSGEEANFSVGGEIPIAQNNAVNSSVDWKQYGTELKISPKVLDGDKISVHVNATVSELDYQNKIDNYPAIRNKKAETNLIMKEGATLAIAGLVSEDKTQSRA